MLILKIELKMLTVAMEASKIGWAKVAKLDLPFTGGSLFFFVMSQYSMCILVPLKTVWVNAHPTLQLFTLHITVHQYIVNSHEGGSTEYFFYLKYFSTQIGSSNY